jgi:hypothetical protein
VIAGLRRSTVSTDTLVALVGTFNLAVLAVVAGYSAIGIVVGAAITVVLVALMTRWAWLIPALVIVGFAVQPALKFYVSDAFGPVKDVAVLVSIAAVAATILRRRFGLRDTTSRLRRPDPVLIVAVLAFIALYAINIGGDHDINWANGARLVVEAFSLLLLGYLGPVTERAWPWVIRSVIAMAIIESTVGLAQQVIGVDRLVGVFGYVYGAQVRQVAGGALRSFGTLDDPFNYAALVLLGFIVATQSRLPRRWKLPLLALIGAGVVVSFDRTDIVLLVLAIGLWLARENLRVAAAALVAVTFLLAGLYVLSSSAAPGSNESQLSVLLSLNGRVDAWSIVLAQPDKLLGGDGVGTTGTGLARSQVSGVLPTVRFGPAASAASTQGGNAQNLDSSYLATLADVGLVGLALLLFIAGRAVTLGSRAAVLGSSAGWTALGTVGLLFLDSTTRTSLTAFPFGYVCLYVLGAALAAGEIQSSTARTRPDTALRPPQQSRESARLRAEPAS